MEVRIEITYKTRKGIELTFDSNMLPVGQAILVADDLEKTGRINTMKFIDQQDQTWTIKDLKKYIEGIQTEPHNVTICFDGGFDLSTKASGLGCAIYYEQNKKAWRIRKNALVEELNSNNEAEYAALHLALQELEALGVHHLSVTIIGDSQVVINQLNGEWPVLEQELNNWADRIESKLEKLGIKPEYKHVSRKNNREADQLAAQALKGVEVISTIELNR